MTGGPPESRTRHQRIMSPLLYQLSYIGLERITGIEPVPVAWKATVLPLNYIRSGVSAVCRDQRRDVHSGNHAFPGAISQHRQGNYTGQHCPVPLRGGKPKPRGLSLRFCRPTTMLGGCLYLLRRIASAMRLNRLIYMQSSVSTTILRITDNPCAMRSKAFTGVDFDGFFCKMHILRNVCEIFIGF